MTRVCRGRQCGVHYTILRCMAYTVYTALFLAIIVAVWLDDLLGRRHFWLFALMSCDCAIVSCDYAEMGCDD